MKNIQLFIHIGTHKTGTTAIQSSLKESYKILKKENIYYFPVSKNAIQLMKIKELDDKLIVTCKKELFRFIKNRKNKNLIKIIWSFEGFSGDSSTGYENTNKIAESLKIITKDIDTKIIIYLRRQDEFVESLYTQMIHQGESYDFESFINKFSEKDFNWSNLLNSYSNYYGKDNLIVRKYDESYLSANGGIINDFTKILSKNIKLNKSLSVNKGYSRDALEIARILNPNLSISEKHLLRSLLRQTSTKQPFENYSYWIDNEQRLFLEKYSKSNFQVTKEFFKGETSELFSTIDSNVEHQNYQGLSTESVVQIIGKAMLIQQRKINESIIIKGLWKIEFLMHNIFVFLGVLKKN